MQYRSPIPVLQYAGAPQEQPDVNNLLRLQKRLLIELDHGGTGSLQVGTQSLTKDDILTLIEDLKQQQSYLFHQWIYDNPRLLTLLEKGAAPTAGPLYDRNLSYRAEFRQFKIFISPYLVQPVGKGINQAFLKRDFATARSFLLARHLLESTFFDDTFGKLGHSLKSLAEELKRTERKEIEFVPDHYGFVDGTFVDFLNDLPEALSQYREMLAIALINLSVEIQRTHADFCQRIYSYLQGLNCSPETKRIIMQNRAIFNRHQEKQETTSGSSNSRSGCGAGIGITFFIITLLRVLINIADDDDHAFTPPQQGQYNVYDISLAEMVYKSFTDRLRHITTRQLASGGKDSIAHATRISPKDETPSVGHILYPYHDFCEIFINYQPQDGKPLQIVNTSAYDLVVFERNQQSIYAAFLPKGETLEAKIASQDKISFYAGNDWSREVTFKAQQPLHAGVERTVRGLFTSVDSTTLHYLKRSYQCTGIHVTRERALKITLTSSAADSLHVEYDRALFEEQMYSF